MLKYFDNKMDKPSCFSVNTEKNLEKCIDDIIVSIIICKIPLSGNSCYKSLLNCFNFFNYKTNKNYINETLYHAYIIVETKNRNNNPTLSYIVDDNSKYVLIEKDVIINVFNKIPSNKIPLSKNVLHKVINHELIPENLTIEKLLSNTLNFMKDSFFPYCAKTNNCQDFVMAILNSNNINYGYESFVKQDTKTIFENIDSINHITNIATTLDADVSYFQQKMKI